MQVVCADGEVRLIGTILANRIIHSTRPSAKQYQFRPEWVQAVRLQW